ncbi:MAG: hypothetical protein K2K51_05535, partial [Bacteroidales bacterium]|nr:hypothetical protein [Bacteroidales bacterium]
ATPLSTSTATYTDMTVKAGRHTYYVEAVYEDGQAMKQTSNQIQVVAPGTSFPVQTIDHRVDYNRFANIYWGVPSSEVAALAKNDIVTPDAEIKGRFDYIAEKTEESATVEPMTTLHPKSYFSTTLDYIANVDMLTYSGRAAVKVGDYYYVTSHMGGGIKVIDRFNDVVKTIYPAKLGVIVSMVYVEEENALYCGTSKGFINVVDLATEEIVNVFEIQAVHLAYVPDMKDGKPGLIAGGSHNCNTYLWNEEEKDFKMEEENYLDFGPLYAMGSAYYKGRLYVSSATGPYRNEVYVYDCKTKQLIEGPIQVVEDPAAYNLLTENGNALLVANLGSITMAGGLSVFELEDGTTALGMVFQCAYMTSRIMLLELESAETVAGYDLYRSVDGGAYAKVNGDEPMISRRYAEMIDRAGQYAYYVVVKSANGTYSEKSPFDTLVIANQGSCPEPEYFTI